jgi:hypothetical protein
VDGREHFLREEPQFLRGSRYLCLALPEWSFVDRSAKWFRAAAADYSAVIERLLRVDAVVLQNDVGGFGIDTNARLGLSCGAKMKS